jgi:uncharacterized protein (DUF1501 family)
MNRTFCDGRSRRDFLRLGTASVFGLGLSLTELLARRARAGEQGQTTRDVSLIYLFLHGGMSHLDTFDLKPDAPAEFRGDFKPIDTNVKGVRISEHLPRVAQSMDKLALIRSFRHHNSDHGPADHYMLTGSFPQAGFNPSLKPNNQRPAHGAVIARKLGPRGSVPPFVCLPKQHPSTGPAYLGAGAAPFVIDADPNAPDFAVPDVVPPPALEAGRLDDRKGLLAQLDRFQQGAEVRGNRDVQAVSVFRQKAFDLMTSPQAKKAFDIRAEDDKLRDAYGRTSLGQSCLMARRLVQAGVRCVTIDHSNWDTHDNNFATLRRELLPTLDGALATLFRDLADRGLLSTTLVIVSGEFGRTPRINNNAGRDHWGPVMSALVAGGGLKMGQAIGTTNALAEYPTSKPATPGCVLSTMYHVLGIDYRHVFYDDGQRPLPVLNEGEPVADLVG